jgi:cytochrome c oxidase cbb3-type subunit I/II
MIYYLVPRLWNTKLYSQKLATYHFWTGLLGILIYYISMWASGITQGLMWRDINAAGQLKYPDFVETVEKIVPLYHWRALGGTLFIIGMLIMLYNVYRTILSAPKEERIPVYKALPLTAQKQVQEGGHRWLEGSSSIFIVLVLVAVLAGSVIEMIPSLSIHKYLPEETLVEPFTPLELAGRDIYVREGCYTCHSQMIRKLPSDVLRYGEASTLGESIYNRPHQWGSKRTGPDLARIGNKYPSLWHYRHMLNPRDVVEKSLMPSYPWLAEQKTDTYSLRKKLSILKRLNVPYADEVVGNADTVAEAQAKLVANELAAAGVTGDIADREIVALIAYLQALGQKSKEKSNAQ